MFIITVIYINKSWDVLLITHKKCIGVRKSCFFFLRNKNSEHVHFLLKFF